MQIKVGQNAQGVFEGVVKGVHKTGSFVLWGRIPDYLADYVGGRPIYMAWADCCRIRGGRLTKYRRQRFGTSWLCTPEALGDVKPPAVNHAHAMSFLPLCGRPNKKLCARRLFTFLAVRATLHTPRTPLALLTHPPRVHCHLPIPFVVSISPARAAQVRDHFTAFLIIHSADAAAHATGWTWSALCGGFRSICRCRSRAQPAHVARQESSPGTGSASPSRSVSSSSLFRLTMPVTRPDALEHSATTPK